MTVASRLKTKTPKSSDCAKKSQHSAACPAFDWQTVIEGESDMVFEDGCDYCNQYQCNERRSEAIRDSARKTMERISQKIDRACRDSPIVCQLLNQIWRGESAEDTLCRIVTALSELNETISRDAITIANHNNVLTMELKDSAYANDVINKSVAKSERIAYLESRVQEQREEIVRLRREH